jgi:hypothetical protein
VSVQSQSWFPLHVLFLSRPVVWDVVLLELLSNMVRRWRVGAAVAGDRGQLPNLSKQTRKHSLLPHVVTRQTHDRNQQKGEVEYRIPP